MARATPIPASSREAVGKRAGWRCERCSAPATNFHHRRSRSIRDSLTHDPSNALWLCGSGTTGCHGWAHHNPKDAREAGIIVSRYEQDPGAIPVKTWHGLVYLTSEGTYRRA